MASLIPYTKKMLIERLKKHMSDDFPSSEFGSSDEEVLLYIDQALAFNLVGQAYTAAKIEGNLAVADAYYTTFILPTLQQDSITREWYTTLPQPPLSLPIGYSITNGYFADSANGKGTNVFWVKAKAAPYRDYMPKPFGVMAKIEGTKVILESSNGSYLLNQNFYVTMASTRSSSLDDVLNLPDDAIEPIFNNVVMKLKDRMQIPKDIVLDDIPAGNKNS
jgi:hypothetical protein